MSNTKNNNEFPARLENCFSFKLDNPGKWTIQGHSKAGERTGFWLTPLRIILDCGLSTYMKPKAIFISHCHTDHSTALPNILTSRSEPIKGQEHLMGRPVFMPKEAIPKIMILEQAFIALSRNNINEKDFSNPDWVWQQQGVHPMGVLPFEKYEIPGIPNILVETFPSYHDVNSIGYGFSSKKQKLKPEYLEMTKTKEGKQKLGKIRKSGIKITDEVIEPQLIFYCDSTIDNLRKHNEWKKYPVIICECTGYPDILDRELIHERSHTHLDDLLPIMLENKNKQWVLIHSSMRMGHTELENWNKILIEKYNLNVFIWRNLQLKNKTK